MSKFIGDAVAENMFALMNPTTKTASKKSCCNCSGKCGADCPCSKDCKDCNCCSDMAMASDSSHVHDANCAHDSEMKSNAVGQMIDMLNKISMVQEELGLYESALASASALQAMVKELEKTAATAIEDSNEISSKEITEELSKDTDTRRDWSNFEREHPDLWALLKQRIDESEAGESSGPVDILEPGSTGDTVMPSMDDTVMPETSLPPESEMAAMRLPAAGDVSGFADLLEEDPNLQTAQEASLGEDLPVDPYGADMPTKAPAKSAFERLDEWIVTAQHSALFDESDFEDDAELPSGEDNEDDRIDDLIQALESEDSEDLGSEDFEMPEIFDEEEDLQGALDSFMASDLGDETELEESTDEHDPFMENLLRSVPEDSYQVRRHNGDMIDFDDLTAEEKEELLSGAGMRERLDIDPDELTESPAAGSGREEEYEDELYDDPWIAER